MLLVPIIPHLPLSEKLVTLEIIMQNAGINSVNDTLRNQFLPHTTLTFTNILPSPSIHQSRPACFREGTRLAGVLTIDIGEGEEEGLLCKPYVNRVQSTMNKEREGITIPLCRTQKRDTMTTLLPSTSDRIQKKRKERKCEENLQNTSYRGNK